ncbi:hypothetical protein [Nocardioides stalactiti]|uniref:hypothetical protein n=1 Tax=Nocardioides stalactiti TaxID=2755356 RepID=UPI001600C04D|nr:hypothetical protein [Nocardioides stalactiti]
MDAQRLRPSASTIALMTAAALASALTGCTPDVSTTLRADTDRRSTPTTPPTVDTSVEADAGASALEGTWQAGPVSLAQTVATVRRSGLGEWVEEYRRNAPFSADSLLTLTIEDGAWDLYGSVDGEQQEPIDYDAAYEIRDDVVVFHHSAGSNTYRWVVDEDTLRLEFVGSTLPGYRGIPEEVFQRALYTTRAFTRQD